MLKGLELEQAYTRLTSAYQNEQKYIQYLTARVQLLEGKVDKERGKWILAQAELNTQREG